MTVSRRLPDDLAAIGAHGIEPIDLVVVNLYPVARAAADRGCVLGPGKDRMSAEEGC